VFSNSASRLCAVSGVVICLLSGLGASGQDHEQTLFDKAPWTVAFGLGYIKFEGDEEVEDGAGFSLRGGYDLSEWWGVEGNLLFAPSLDPRKFNDDRFALNSEIWALDLGADLLLHLRNTDNLRWDPFLAVGVGFLFFEESLGSGKTVFAVDAGGGLQYHLGDKWALRGDIRTGIVGGDTEAKLIGSLSAVYRIGVSLPMKMNVRAGELDSDSDGLLDSREAEIGTDPYNPDSDADGLSDGQEVDRYSTDPLNQDSDFDGLKDGAEVLTYRTEPLEQDTDEGGVADGHEVIEDETNPLDKADDLMVYTLYIEFDYDKAIIRPDDYDELDVISKALMRYPDASARIEGHADKRKTSKRDYNLTLSTRRAKAVRDYLVDNAGFNENRFTFVGYGFDRPVAPNDTEENMQKNRRVEVYIRKDGQPASSDSEHGGTGVEASGISESEPEIESAPGGNSAPIK
jgi:outer membrane protein OmpA-like peptidoglycan-associated protein/opacity protein-like surface antigen